MLSSEEAKIVELVYRRLMEGEEHSGWDELDYALEHLEYLDHDQAYREASIQLEMHRTGKISCSAELDNSDGFAAEVVDAVELICKLYKDTGYLPIKNRYILDYYLALSHLKMIISV